MTGRLGIFISHFAAFSRLLAYSWPRDMVSMSRLLVTFQRCLVGGDVLGNVRRELEEEVRPETREDSRVV